MGVGGCFCVGGDGVECREGRVLGGNVWRGESRVDVRWGLSNHALRLAGWMKDLIRLNHITRVNGWDNGVNSTTLEQDRPQLNCSIDYLKTWRTIQPPSS